MRLLAKGWKRGRRSRAKGGASVTRRGVSKVPGKSFFTWASGRPSVWGLSGFQIKSYQRIPPPGLRRRSISDAMSCLVAGSRMEENAVNWSSKSKLPAGKGRCCPLAVTHRPSGSKLLATRKRSKSRSTPTRLAGAAPKVRNSFTTPPEPQPSSKIRCLERSVRPTSPRRATISA